MCFLTYQLHLSNFAPSEIYRQLYLSKTSISEGYPSLKNIVDPIYNLSYDGEEKKSRL